MKNHHHSSPIHPHAAPAPAPLHEVISIRAWELWTERGHPENQSDAIWLEAEAQLVAGQHENPVTLSVSRQS